MIVLLAQLAVAEPSVVVDGPSVVGTVTIAVSVAEVHRRVTDPEWVASVGGAGKTQVTIVSETDSCQVLDYFTESAITNVEYRVQQCVDEVGANTTLIESRSFNSYESSWNIVESEAGALVTYRVSLDTSLPVPEFMVRRNTRRSVRKMLTDMETWFIAHPMSPG